MRSHIASGMLDHKRRAVLAMDLIQLGEALRSNNDVAHRTTPSPSFKAWGSTDGAASLTKPSSSVFSLSALPVLTSKAKRSVKFPYCGSEGLLRKSQVHF